MDKTLQKVTKDRKRQETARKCREKYMNKLQESILNEAKIGGEDTSNADNEATNATNSVNAYATSSTTRSSDTYIYGVDIVAVLTIGACVFFAYKKKSSQAVKKEQLIEEQQQPKKPPKRRNML